MAETIVTSRYSTDYGMFRFCIANTEEDWRPGTEQYKFIEHCLSSVFFESNGRSSAFQLRRKELA
jgi:hypothetical protein